MAHLRIGLDDEDFDLASNGSGSVFADALVSRRFEFDSQAPAAVGKLGGTQDASFLRGGGGIWMRGIREDDFDGLMNPVAGAIGDDQHTVAGEVDGNAYIVEGVEGADSAADENAHAEFDAATAAALGAGAVFREADVAWIGGVGGLIGFGVVW